VPPDREPADPTAREQNACSTLARWRPFLRSVARGASSAVGRHTRCRCGWYHLPRRPGGAVCRLLPWGPPGRALGRAHHEACQARPQASTV